jgi:hypothetical protein
MDLGTVLTVWYFLFYFSKTVPRSNRINKTKNTTLSEQFLDPIEKLNKKYHTIGTVPKSNTKIKQKIPHCRNSS